jgi:4'-phosphopantetheinyl transferase EntD
MQLIGWSLSNQYERCRRLHFGALWIVLMTPTKSSAFVLGRHSVLQRKSLCNHTYRNQYTLSALLPGPKGLRQIETHGRPLHSPPVSKIFDLVLPEGRCVGLTFIDHDCQLEDAMQRDSLQAQDHWINDFLHEDEVRYACSMAGASPMNRLSFILGRMAMRTILKDDASNSPILKDAHGRPTLPDGYLGSISHKQTTAVALVAQYDHTDSKMGIGIDLEYVTESKAKIATRVLTKAEMENLGFVNVSALYLWRIMEMLITLTPLLRLSSFEGRVCVRGSATSLLHEGESI